MTHCASKLPRDSSGGPGCFCVSFRRTGRAAASEAAGRRLDTGMNGLHAMHPDSFQKASAALRLEEMEQLQK